MVPDTFPPLQGAIAQAESWTGFLKSGRQETSSASLESIVWVGVKIGELLPITWRLAFDNLLRPRGESWQTVEAFEAARKQVLRLFFTAREAMDLTKEAGETLQAMTGRQPAGLDRLLVVIEEARQLEETVFRDWPSFLEPLPSADLGASLPVDESLAEALGIPVAEARQKLDTRRRELNAERE